MGSHSSFAPYQPAGLTSYRHEIFSTPSTDGEALPVSPVLSISASQRTSISSGPAADIFNQISSAPCHSQRLKDLDQSNLELSSEGVTIGSDSRTSSLVSVPSSSYSSCFPTAFYNDQASTTWQKAGIDPAHELLPPISNLSFPLYSRHEQVSEPVPVPEPAPARDTRKVSSAIVRPKQRKRTTKEDANFQCPFNGCGKLFSRSYNFKAHMETHDESREYPFPCQIPDCTKKFVRKTDLQRHHQSVHMRQRNHKCDYCNRHFARKDTLRRHMEDGCSRRFDIETVEFRTDVYNAKEQTSTNALRNTEIQLRSSMYNPPQLAPPLERTNNPDDRLLASSHGPLLVRPPYYAQSSSQGGLWSN